ncbi:potassium/proton antiporter [Paenibacillus aurantius]|uniref:Potassium/proton antiporter n=1 Tax=Paenibacillus aurantius TaxID=2918900 RepID=A0AA96RE19_9BACL|nr:potassium/proton antiporter [Paenibacillus aurantius]WNQ10031.1 potassium/proton antiporter [Paenibacillus aurantius]
MAVITNDFIIVLFASLLLFGVLATKFTARFNLPSLVFYIAVGMLIGHYFFYDNASLTQIFGIFALIVILFDGGLQTKWKDIRPVAGPALSLATVGVLLTAGIIGVAAKFLLGVGWLEALLFGSIVGSTDAAAVFAVLGNKNVKRSVSSTLEAESGTNDPMAVFLTVSLIELIHAPDTSLLVLALLFLWEMGAGLLLGLLFGKLAVWVINRINLESSGLYPILALSFAILCYGCSALLHASGLLAVYVAAVAIGNSEFVYRHAIVRFNEGFVWLMQILMFTLLGMLVFPEQLRGIIMEGVALSLILMFVARPVGVYISTLFTRFTGKEKLLLSWAGLRGAVPIVLATYPVMAQLNIGVKFFNVVFFVVFTSALIQGSTISWLAERLGLSSGKKPSAPHSLELVSTEETDMEMREVTVNAGSEAAEHPLHRLELPSGTVISAIVRNGEMVAPTGSSELMPGDMVYVLGPKENKEQVKGMFGHKEKEAVLTGGREELE